MIPYLACLASFVTSSYVSSKILRGFLLYCPIIIVCFGYMTGSDWRTYELVYTGEIQKIFEPGISTVFNIGNRFKLSFWTTLIIIKTLCYLKTILIFQKFFSNKSGIFLALFFAEWGFYLFIDNPLRSFISFYFSLFFLDNFLSSKYKKSFVFAVLALFFHYSSIILFFFYFFKKPFKSTFIYLAVFVFFFTITTFYFEEFLMITIDVIYGYLLESRLLSYLVNNEFLQTENKIGYIHRIFFLLLLTLNIKNLSTSNTGNIAVAYALIYIILYPITSKIIVLKRIDLFLVLPFCMALFYISNLKKKWRRAFISTIIFYSFLKSVLLFQADYRYVPYSNIIVETIKGSRYDYYQRAKFNHQNSPYED